MMAKASKSIERHAKAYSKEPIVKTAYRTLLLAGTFFLLSPAQEALANHSNHGGISAREFRHLNPGMDDRSLRQARLETRQLGNSGTNHVHHDNRLQRHDNSHLNSANQAMSTVIGSQLDPLTVVENRQGIVLDKDVNLDLSSAQKNIVLGKGLFSNNQSVTINEGGVEKTFSADSQVTAAEYMAVKQVLAGGAQSLVLNGDGRAVAGSLDLGAIVSSNEKIKTAGLINPAGVTVYGDFGRSSNFDLSGDLVNSGTVYAYSSHQRVRGGVISADNISNESGALISSVLPSESAGEVKSSVKHLNLSLAARNDFLNLGTIESSGDLTITAGGTLTNGRDTGSGATPVIAANGNITLQSPEISNAGLISSHNGNITLDSPSALNVYNSNSIEALNGSINLRSPNYNGAFDTNAAGGNWLSQELNIQSGGGVTSLDVQNITGVVNQTGTAAHLTAATEDLNLGSICLTGDPTFYNTAGAINIGGGINVGEALTIIASGNITTGNNLDVKAGVTNQGFPITLIAGANIIATAGGANVTTIPPLTNNGGATLDGTGSASGGFVSLGISTRIISGPLQNLNNGSGGDILVVAFSGASINSGSLLMNAGSGIFSEGSTQGIGNNGNITVIGNNGHTIVNMDSGTARGFGGAINIFSATPVKSTTANIVYQANGSLAAGSSQFVPGTAFGGNVVFNGSVNSISSVDVHTNGNITVNGTGLVDARITRFTNAGNILVQNNGRVNGKDFLGIDTQGNVTSAGTGVLSSGGQLDIVTTQNAGAGNLSRLNVDTVNLSVVSDSTFINCVGGVNLGTTLVGTGVEVNTAVGVMDILAHGNLTINKDVTVSNGDLILQTTTGRLETLVGFAFPNMTANNGDISLINSGVNKKTDKIVLAGSGTIQGLGKAGNGNVLISLGVSSAPVAGKAPKNVVLNPSGGGQFFFSKKGITASADFVNTLNAQSANITFNNSINKKNIFLNGVTITADP